jgi:glucose-6-phosphate 1-epimerase
MNLSTYQRLHQLVASTNSVRLSHTAAEYPKHFHNDGLPILVIDHPVVSAKCLLQGAQLLEFKPKGQPDWLWLSPLARLKQQEAIRGGVPICFPWFGPHKKDASKPKHGFARQTQWQLDNIQSLTDAIVLTFSMSYPGSDSTLHQLPFRIECKYTLGHSITIDCTIHNTANVDQCFSYAFHTYFSITDLPTTRVSGIAGIDYLDNTKQQQRFSQVGDIDFNQEIDRLFPVATQTQQLVSNSHTTPINIRSNDQESCIIWNPWQATAEKMPDISKHYNEFVCIERGNIEEKTVKLNPDQLHQSQLIISKPIN